MAGAQYWKLNLDDDMKATLAELAGILTPSEMAELELSTRHSVIRLRDILVGFHAHDMDLPLQISEDLFQKVDSLGEKQLSAILHAHDAPLHDETLRLASGPLITMTLDKLADKEEKVFSIVSAHDVSVAV